MVEFPVRLKLIIRKVSNRCPKKLKPLGGPLLGGIIGLIGGIAGFVIGVLLGFLLRELCIRYFKDRKLLGYFENPGFGQFHEAEPGLAAWCALAVLVSSADTPHSSSAVSPGSPSGLSRDHASERILKQILLEASRIFSGSSVDPFLIGHFSRAALSIRGKISQDLLAESLVSRRISLNAKNSPEDLRKLGQGLGRLATGTKSKQIAREIRLVLDPSFASEQEPEISGIHDPWKILGLSPGTSQKEIKSHYRKLAKLFHPDELVVLDEQRRETAASAFIAIQQAYKEITRATPASEARVRPL